MKLSNRTLIFSTFLLITTGLLFFCGPLMIQSMYQFKKVDEKGQIGDAFGGSMGPVIGWIAALLTFAAFYIQYQANKEQREQFERQAKDIAVQRFENRFFELLKFYKENINEMLIEGYDLNESHETKTSGSVTSFDREKTTKKEVVKKEIVGKKIFVTTYTELKACYQICEEVLRSEIFLNKERYLMKLAYLFFYNGVGSNIVTEVDNSIANDKNYVQDCKEELVRASKNHVASSGKINKHIVLSGSQPIELYVKYKPFSGHASRFGHYYRHLFQTVKYVVEQKDDVINYLQKREYLRILRAQLSDQEQAMLYFNYLSGFGANWETSDNKFFSDYRMIHNMPLHMADFTIKPVDEFKDQIAKIRSQGEEMFEAFE